MEADTHKFPHILFVGDFSLDSLALTGFPRQLLTGYPADRISSWYWRSSGGPKVTEFKVGTHYRWRLPDRLVPNRRLKTLKGAILENIWIPISAWHLRRTVAIAKPDVVWVLLFSWPILLADQAWPGKSPRLHVSYWDVPDTVPQKEILGAPRTQRFLDAIFRLIRKAHSVDGISPAILEEIEAGTGRKDAMLLHSGFEPQHLRALEQQTPASDDVIRLAYVGSIISEKSFREVIMALEKARAKLSQKLVLEFYGVRNHARQSWFNPEWMMEHGMLSDEELVESLRRCSWGIVVMDLDGEDLRYSKFSFPNKIGTYLSAGVPVIGFGHPETSLARLMRAYPVGKFASARDQQALEVFLYESLKTAKPREAFHQPILQCARTEFNVQEFRRRLWQAWGARDFNDAQK